jgi:GNAT superfamily N-acetyltransferase
MTELVASLSDSKLKNALLRNMTAFWAAYGRAPGCFLDEDAGTVWFYTGIDSPLFNGVVSIDTDDAGVASIHAALKGKIAARKAPALWWVCPESRPENVAEQLLRLGLGKAGSVPAMAVDLATLSEQLPPVKGLTVRRVGGADDQRLWGRIAAEGTGFTTSAAERFGEFERSIVDAGYLAQRRYLGFLDGAPVASSALVLDSGVAGIYAVATLEAARRRGIGGAMTLVPLLEARGEGYHIGILQASSKGYPIYKKMGFRDLHSFDLYIQTAPPGA